MSVRAALFFAAMALVQSAQPNVYRSLESGTPVHNAGRLAGVIVSVDYAQAGFTLREGERTRSIAIMPNTTIVRHGETAGLWDLRAGMRVTVAAYEVAGRLVAQTIRIAP